MVRGTLVPRGVRRIPSHGRRVAILKAPVREQTIGEGIERLTELDIVHQKLDRAARPAAQLDAELRRLAELARWIRGAPAWVAQADVLDRGPPDSRPSQAMSAEHTYPLLPITHSHVHAHVAAKHLGPARESIGGARA